MDCSESRQKEVREEAKQFADEKCKITEPLPRYDPALEYRCTPDDYEAGARESYSPNAYLCFCRHNCTNYEELIEPFDRESHYPADHAFYEAIRKRIDDLLEELIESQEIEDDEDDEEFDEDEET